MTYQRPAYEQVTITHGDHVVVLRPSLSEVRALLSYDPATGIFRRRIATANSFKPGDVAGEVTKKGYIRIRLQGRRFFAHRLAWFYMTGAWPEHEIDHINGNRSDNRFANLREATRTENSRNKIAANSTGFKGVKAANGKFRASLTVNGKRLDLGRYTTPEEAHAAYVEAANDAFGEFARAS